MSLTVRVLKNRVVIDLKKRRRNMDASKCPTTSGSPRFNKAEWLDECTADAITNWAEGKESGLCVQQSAQTSNEIPNHELKPFSLANRELVIYADRIEICGIRIWTDTGVPDLRDALLLLRHNDNGCYVRMKGPTLMEKLGRDSSNPIGRPIKDFCDRATELLARQRGLACGRYDVIDSRGGYHLTDWIHVSVAEGEAHELKVSHEPDEPAKKCDEPDCDDIVRKLSDLPCEQANRLRALCAALTSKPVRNIDIRRLSNVSRAQNTRDLRVLVERGLLVKTGPQHDRLYRLAVSITQS